MSAAGSRAGGLRRWAEIQLAGQHEDKLLLVLTLIIGAVVGLVVVAFILLTENLGARMYPAGGAAWRRVLIPVWGALGTGILLYRYFPDARGSGIPQTKAALFIRDGFISFRTVLGKFGLSSVSLASGMALGREGPSVQVGAGIASVLGRRLGLSPSRVRALVPVGASAALAAAFNTPIAAVLFSLEEVMGDLHAPVLGSIVLSSATSWMVLHLILGDEPLFHVPAYQLVHPVEFVFYAVLGVAGGLVSVGFVKLLLWQRERFLRLPARSRWWQPVVGGLTVGLLGWFVPQVLGVGYGYVSQALNGQMMLRVMALLVLLKVVATATCYASGNAGGIFGPSLFMGAMLGGAVGGAAHNLMPDFTASVGAYALVGMGTAFAGIVRVPLTSVIMIFEVTRDYSIIVPLMISNLISYFISSRLQEEPIYEALQHQDGIHLPGGARGREFLTVAQGAHAPARVIAADETVEQALGAARREEGAWPVVDAATLLGMVSLSQLEHAIEERRGGETVAQILPPPDPRVQLTAESFPHVHRDHSLDTAMRRMAETGLHVLPVVSRANVRELQGVISLPDVLAAYGLAGGREAGQPAAVESRTSLLLAAGIAAVLTAALVLTGFLNYYYRASRGERAQRYFQQGNELAAKERYAEAIDPYRSALSISHSGPHRLALANALLKAGRLNEAQIYFRELLRADPAGGPANLGLGRVAAAQGDTQTALPYYHRAIYGAWPDHAQEHKVQARLELVGVLGKAGQGKPAQAELLTLLTEAPSDAATRKTLGHMLLDYGLARESAEVFRTLAQRDAADAGAYAGLADAEFAMGDYPAARRAYRSAVKLNPADAAARQRLELCDQIVALDPALRGLRAVERFQRSRRVLEGALAALEPCAAGKAVDPAAQNTARKLLADKRRPASFGDAAEANLSAAEAVWQIRVKACGTPGGAQEALAQVLAHVSRR